MPTASLSSDLIVPQTKPIQKSIAKPTGIFSVLGLLAAFFPSLASAATEAELRMPDLASETFTVFNITGSRLLTFGLIICIIGLAFGLIIFKQIKALPVHPAMLEISELIYETCKTYLFTQAKFLLLLKVFIGAIMVIYFGFLATNTNAEGHIVSGFPPLKVAVIILFSFIGIAGSYSVAWFGIRLNNYANSRTAFASLRGQPYPCYAVPLKAGISIGMVLVSLELLILLSIILFLPADYAGPCFIGFAIGESLGASVLRIAGGIFTKIADIGSDLMKIVFNIKEDDARNPGVIADCAGDNAGDSVGPTADGFETYGVTAVALVSFILLAITPARFLPDGVALAQATAEQITVATAAASKFQVQLLVWMFAVQLTMIVASGVSYLLNESLSRARYGDAEHFDFEKPLTNLVWLTSILTMAITFLVSYLLIPNLGGDPTLWWKLSLTISLGTLAGALIPELVKFFTSTSSAHVREVVTSSKEGGASLNILSGLVAGNFSAFWMGMILLFLMGATYLITGMGLSNYMIAPAVFGFGLLAFGFLSMAPVTIAVDSYGPVTDNAQSVYELSLIETQPNIVQQLQKDHGFKVDFEKAKHFLEQNDGAGNTFKATSKPVLIGTAVVGATTMIFSIIMMLTGGLTFGMDKLSILHAPFLLGLIAGGSVIYWFTGASIQAVVTGAYRAVEYIKANIKLDNNSNKASTEDSKKVVEICTEYAQKGMLNIFFAVFFATLSFAFAEPYFFIGYLIAIALFGLFQAVFMANAGGAWDNAKKLVEVELKAKNTPLHAATVVGDTVGDPFKDTSSVAMNPVIKFTTLFGLLAVELAVVLNNPTAHSATASDFKTTGALTTILSGVFFLIALFFVWRSFYAMRIRHED